MYALTYKDTWSHGQTTSLQAGSFPPKPTIRRLKRIVKWAHQSGSQAIASGEPLEVRIRWRIHWDFMGFYGILWGFDGISLDSTGNSLEFSVEFSWDLDFNRTRIHIFKE